MNQFKITGGKDTILENDNKNKTNNTNLMNSNRSQEENRMKVENTVDDSFLTISEQNEILQKEQYLKYHDSFTGLHNRLYFMEELPKLDIQENLPLTIVLCDVNKLKLVNDSLGCRVGDKLLKSFSSIFQRACHKGDLLARIENDEFACILLNTDPSKALQKIEKIKSQIFHLPSNTLEISVSFGYNTKTDQSEDIFDIMKDAEEMLEHEKQTEKRDLVKKTVILILKTMFDKYRNEKEHSKRVGSLREQMGKYLGLPPKEIHKLKIAGAMHDIGKIAVDEKVLYKKGKLTRREWIQVKSHAEAGYRILNSSQAFSAIAPTVLQHHEKWDGTGYPKGLKGEEILLSARVIAIVEAYDALTAFKTYRKQLSKDEAFEEIIRCSGTQFDPEIVKVFVKFFKD